MNSSTVRSSNLRARGQLLGRQGRDEQETGNSRRFRILLIVSLFALIAGLGVVSHSNTVVTLQQSRSAPLYLRPRSTSVSKSLPLHIQVPLDGMKVDYTLVESPLNSHNMLEEEESEEAESGKGEDSAQSDEKSPNSSAATSVTVQPLKCNLRGITVDGNEEAQIDIKAEALKAFAMWDKCKLAPDYKEANKGNFNASRRLLTYDLIQPQTWNYPSAPNATDKCGGPSFPCPNVGECEELAAKQICKYLARCTNPVCSSYYVDVDVQRLCGICTMAAPAVNRGCWSSFHNMLRCIGWA